MRILAIGAHPDDLEYGCGGSLVYHAQEGHEVLCVVVTDGELGAQKRNQRLTEMTDAMEVLGVSALSLHFADTEVQANFNALIKSLDGIVKDYDPTLIYTHHPSDVHQDHVCVSRASRIAARCSQSVLYFESFCSEDFKPNIYRVLDDTVVSKKLEALKCHASQIQRSGILERCEAALVYHGQKARAKYAEGFESLRYRL